MACLIILYTLCVLLVRLTSDRLRIYFLYLRMLRTHA